MQIDLDDDLAETALSNEETIRELIKDSATGCFYCKLSEISYDDPD